MTLLISQEMYKRLDYLLYKQIRLDKLNQLAMGKKDHTVVDLGSYEKSEQKTSK